MRKILPAVIIVVLLVLVSFMSVTGKELKYSENVNVSSEKELTREHIKYLIMGLFFTRERQINVILLRIIFNILKDGSATSDEIQQIIKSSFSKIQEAYVLAEIKTIDSTDGGTYCRPGVLKAIKGSNVNGVFCKYSDDCFKEYHGWSLHVDGELISKNEGYIFGYTGYIESNVHGEIECFNLDGFGVLILHE